MNGIYHHIDEGLKKSIKKRYGSVDDYLRLSKKRLREWNFSLISTNPVGRKYPDFIAEDPYVYTVTIPFHNAMISKRWGGGNPGGMLNDGVSWHDVPNVFHPFWAVNCDVMAREMTRGHVNTLHGGNGWEVFPVFCGQ